jgi:hypothetical protein
MIGDRDLTTLLGNVYVLCIIALEFRLILLIIFFEILKIGTKVYDLMRHVGYKFS